MNLRGAKQLLKLIVFRDFIHFRILRICRVANDTATISQMDEDENTMQKGLGTHISPAVEGHESETKTKVACYLRGEL